MKRAVALIALVFGLIGLLIGMWLAVLTSPVRGPLNEWRSIREKNAKGEALNWIRAGYEVAWSFLIGTFVLFPLALFPLVVGGALLWRAFG
jgi:hypothetical protein